MKYFMINDDKAECSIRGALFTVNEIKSIKRDYEIRPTTENYHRLCDIWYHSTFIETSQFNTYKFFGSRFVFDNSLVKSALYPCNENGIYII